MPIPIGSSSPPPEWRDTSPGHPERERVESVARERLVQKKSDLSRLVTASRIVIHEGVIKVIEFYRSFFDPSYLEAKKKIGDGGTDLKYLHIEEGDEAYVKYCFSLMNKEQSTYWVKTYLHDAKDCLPFLAPSQLAFWVEDALSRPESKSLPKDLQCLQEVLSEAQRRDVLKELIKEHLHLDRLLVSPGLTPELLSAFVDAFPGFYHAKGGSLAQILLNPKISPRKIPPTFILVVKRSIIANRLVKN